MDAEARQQIADQTQEIRESEAFPSAEQCEALTKHEHYQWFKQGAWEDYLKQTKDRGMSEEDRRAEFEQICQEDLQSHIKLLLENEGLGDWQEFVANKAGTVEQSIVAPEPTAAGFTAEAEQLDEPLGPGFRDPVPLRQESQSGQSESSETLPSFSDLSRDQQEQIARAFAEDSGVENPDAGFIKSSLKVLENFHKERPTKKTREILVSATPEGGKTIKLYDQFAEELKQREPEEQHLAAEAPAEVKAEKALPSIEDIPQELQIQIANEIAIAAGVDDASEQEKQDILVQIGTYEKEGGKTRQIIESMSGQDSPAVKVYDEFVEKQSQQGPGETRPLGQESAEVAPFFTELPLKEQGQIARVLLELNDGIKDPDEVDIRTMIRHIVEYQVANPSMPTNDILKNMGGESGQALEIYNRYVGEQAEKKKTYKQ